MTHLVEPPMLGMPTDAPRSADHLTAEQLAFYDANGYLVLRNWIPTELLQRLQAASTAWIADGSHVHPTAAGDDYNFAARPTGPALFRVNYLHNKGQVASLELLGAPQVLAVAESLCGPNFVPTYESLVFKQAGDGEQIPWHQDAVHPTRKHRIFNFDLYLDPSHQGAGALRVIPGSHTTRQDICALTDAYGWEHPDAIEVTMEPGDVLLHNVMVVHGSPRIAGKGLRRTMYYEFRSVEEILEDGPWDAQWIDRRLRLIPLGLHAYAQQNPTGSGFTWKIDPAYRPLRSNDAEAELKVAHTVHMSGSYCSAGDAKRAEG